VRDCQGRAPSLTNRPMLIVRCSLFVVRCSLFVVRCSLFVVRTSFFVLRSSFFVIHYSACAAASCGARRSVSVALSPAAEIL
jgi:hypothetical protein